MAIFGQAAACLFFVAAVACGKSNASPAPSASAPSAATASGEPAAPVASGAASKPGVGLDAPENDAAVVAAVRAALPCKWENWGFDAECPEYRAFRDARDGYAEGAADATLVRLLDDPEEKVRFLAANKLAAWGQKFRADAELAPRVVAAAAREKTTKFVLALGRAVAQIDFAKTGTWDAAKSLMETHESGRLRAAIVGSMLFHNKDDAAFSFAMAAVKDKDRDVRRAAIDAFGLYGGEKKDEVCKFYLDNLQNADEAIAARAAANLGAGFAGKHCDAHFDALLDEVERRAKEKLFHEEYAWSQAVGNVCTGWIANGAQRTRALVLAKKIAAWDTKGSALRMAALEAVMKCDPFQGKWFVSGYAVDRDEQVRRRARDLVTPR